MMLSDAVAAQVLGELHILTKNIENQAMRVEELASNVVDAAKQISASKAILHSQNEAMLVRRVNEITEAINQFRGIEGAIQQAARAQAEAAISPLVARLKDKDVQAMKYYVAAQDVYRTIADKVNSTLIILGICFAAVVGSSFYTGMLIGASRTEKIESQARDCSLNSKK